MTEALPSKRVLRRMGYLRDQEGIMRRYLREGAGWQEHLEHCRDFITRAFPELPGKHGPSGTVAVLGSGWLLDLPLDHLRKRFSRICLADICHPPQVRKKVENLEGVSCLEVDLSGGGIAQAWEWSRLRPRQRPSFLETLRLKHPLAGIPADALISLNLLNQLDILICDFLLKKGFQPAEDLAPLRQKIQVHHLEWIRRQAACLITDVSEANVDQDGKRREKDLVHAPLPEAAREESWEWAFDHSGNYHPGQQTSMKVRALEWS